MADTEISETEQNANPTDKKTRKSEKKTRKKRKKSRKIWILLVILILIAAVVWIVPSALLKKAGIGTSIYVGDVYTVGKRDIQDTVSATGLVKSADDTTAKVYSTLSYKVADVNVELGDTVEAGDVLCVYETEMLDRQIRELELSMTASERTAALNLASAKLNYETMLAQMQSGIQSSVVNAQTNYENAVASFDNARKDYDEYAEKLDSGAVIELNGAKRAVEDAQKEYDDLKSEIDNKTHAQIKSAQKALDSAKETYEDYKEWVRDDETTELHTAATGLENAYHAYMVARERTEKAEAALKNQHTRLAELEAELAQKEEELAEASAAPDPDEAKIAELKQRIGELGQMISKQQENIVEAEKTVASLTESEDSFADLYDQADEAYGVACRAADATLKGYLTQYENAEDNYNNVLDTLSDTLDSYETALQNARDNYESAQESADKKLEGYETALNSAKRALDNAAMNLESAKIAADQQLESYRISYENAKNGADTTLSDYKLANLYEDLGKTTVTAPISGTVTAVYATAGESITGVMFVIEDTNNLVVTSTVKAYDLDRVHEGMKVIIKSDASGDAEYTGVIESLAPTAKKDASGSVVPTNDAEFETIVRVTDSENLLRIGVSARLAYVAAEMSDTLAVPESAILSDADGSFVLTVTENEEGAVMLARTPVTCGVSDGIYVAVTGLDDGARIADNAENYAALAGIPLSYTEVDPFASSAGMYAFMGMMP